MKPGEQWGFHFAFGGKKVLHPPKAEVGHKVLLVVPKLNEIDTMKGDFVTFKAASHLTSSVILASAALATMTLY